MASKPQKDATAVNLVATGRSQEVSGLRLRFWPMLIGVLAIIWGSAKLARYVLGVSLPSIINVYVWSAVAIIVGLWFISCALRETWKR